MTEHPQAVDPTNLVPPDERLDVDPPERRPPSDDMDAINAAREVEAS